MLATENEFFFDQSEPNHCPEEGRIGDCFRACLAAVFRRPLSDIPLPSDDDKEWLRIYREWLLSIGFLRLHFEVPTLDWFPTNLDEFDTANFYYIVSGPSPRFPGVLHSVVGCNGRLVHDPHPSREFLSPDAEQYSFEVFTPAYPK